MAIDCYHLLNIKRSKSALELVKSGDLIIRGCWLCDWKVPTTREQVQGQDITCVGPNSSDCPDPKSAKIV